APARLDGITADDQRDHRSLLPRQVGRLFTFENPARIEAYQAECIRQAGAIAHQAAGRGKFAKLRDHWNRVLERKRGDLLGSANEERVSHKHQPTDTLLTEACEGA